MMGTAVRRSSESQPTHDGRHPGELPEGGGDGPGCGDLDVDPAGPHQVGAGHPAVPGGVGRGRGGGGGGDRAGLGVGAAHLPRAAVPGEQWWSC